MFERIRLMELAASLCRDGDRQVAHAAHGPVSRAEFVEQIQAWRQAFAAEPGQRHALHLDDSMAFAAALLGAWQAGKTVFLPADTLPSTLHSIRSEVDGFAGSFPHALQAATDTAASRPEFMTLAADEPRLVLYTSGSSGDPVAISKTLRQLDTEVAALESRFGDRLGTAIVHGTVSHQHIYGLLFRVLWPLSMGRPFASQRLAYPEQIAAAIASEPTILVASPALLKRLPQSSSWSQVASVPRVVFSSGGPLPAEAGDAIRKLWQQPVVEVFGSTETGGIAARESGEVAWQALPGVQWRIEQGLLQVNSPHLANRDWHETQDRARAVGEGFELLGRADRLVKLEERRISLSAIERVLQSLPWVEEARVLMLTGKRSRIGAVIVPSAAGKVLLESEGRKLLGDRLRSALTGQVDAIANPRHWRFVEAMPGNSEGKATEKLLASLFQSGQPVPRWLQRDAAQALLTVTAESELAVFDGHFPQSPIVPGVALVDWAIGWGRQAFAIDLDFQRMDALKFQRLVAPGTELDLSMGWQAETGVLSIRFESAQGVHASGRIVFAVQGRST